MEQVEPKSTLWRAMPASPLDPPAVSAPATAATVAGPSESAAAASVPSTAPLGAGTGHAPRVSIRRVSARQWALLNLKIGGLSFGGSSRMLMYQDAVVREHQWVTPDEFAEYLTVAQILPGPNLINMSVYLGYRLCGPLGTVLGLLGLALPGSVLAVIVAASLPLDQPDLNEILRGVSIGSFAMMSIFLWNLSKGMRRTRLPKVNVPARKLALRIALAAAVGGLSLAGVPLHGLIAGGAVVCIAVEFLI